MMSLRKESTMGPTVINGLPAHVLLVHAVVVFVPLAALLVILSAVWPAARRRLGIITPIVALIAVAVIPPTTNAGEWLIRRVDTDAELHRHAHLADTLLPIAIGLFVLAAFLWVAFAKPHWLSRNGRPDAPRTDSDGSADETVLVGAGHGETEGATTVLAPAAPAATATRTLPTWLKATRIVAAVLAVAVSVGAVVDVVLIGDSGAQSAWSDSFSMTPKSGHGG
jgi:hypothetical protein